MASVWKYLKERRRCGYPLIPLCFTYDTLREGDVQNITLPTGESIRIKGYERSSDLFSAIINLVSLLSTCFWDFGDVGGLKWRYRSCHLSHATTVLLTEMNGNYHLVKKVFGGGEGVGGGAERRWFVWRYHRFTWCPNLRKFKRVRNMDEIGLRFSDIHGLCTGLDEARYQSRKNVHGHNRTQVERASPFCIWLRFVLCPFRFFQLGCIVLWFLRRHYVNIVFFSLITFVEIIARAAVKYQYVNQLHQASLDQVDSCCETVVSDAKEQQVLSEDLVPGCVIEISRRGCLVSCDAIILAGSCLVFQSLSKPIHKYQLPKSRTDIYDMKKHSQHTLLRGSTVILISDKIIALVIRTGWSTEHGTILASKMEERQHPTVFDRHLDRLFVFMALIGISSSAYAFFYRMLKYPSIDVWVAAVESLELLSIALPPLFPVAVLLTSAYPLFRLYWNGFRFHQATSPISLLNRLGATDTICLLENAVLKDAETCLLETASTRYQQWSRDHLLTLCMATCNSLSILNDQKLNGNPIEMQIFPESHWRVVCRNEQRIKLFNCAVGFDVQATWDSSKIYKVRRIYSQQDSYLAPLTLVRVDPVNSNLDSWYFMKGSPASILSCIDSAVDLNEDIATILTSNDNLVAFAARPVMESEKPFSACHNVSRLMGSKNFQLLGVTALHSKISKTTSATIARLRDAHLRVVFISRRGRDEAVQLARNAGILFANEAAAKIEISFKNETGDGQPSIFIVNVPNDRQQVWVLVGSGEYVAINCDTNTDGYAHIVLDGETLDSMNTFFPLLVDQVIRNVTIFASNDPVQTDHFLAKLESLGRKMIICKENGDPAPASATTCLTLAPNEEQRVLYRGVVSSSSNINCIVDLLLECRSSLVGSLDICKSFICYALARVASILFLNRGTCGIHRVQSIFIDFGLIALPTLVFGRTPSEGVLSSRIPAASVRNVTQMMGIIVQVVFIVAGQWIGLELTQQQSWFEKGSKKEETCGSYEDYVVFSISIFQYLSLFLIFSSGPPHRQRIWKNCYLSLVLLVMTVSSIVLVLQPLDCFRIWMEMRLPPIFSFRMQLVALAFVYLLCSLVAQYLIDFCANCFIWWSTSAPTSDIDQLHQINATDRKLDSLLFPQFKSPVLAANQNLRSFQSMF